MTMMQGLVVDTKSFILAVVQTELHKVHRSLEEIWLISIYFTFTISQDLLSLDTNFLASSFTRS